MKAIWQGSEINFTKEETHQPKRWKTHTNINQKGGKTLANRWKTHTNINQKGGKTLANRWKNTQTLTKKVEKVHTLTERVKKTEENTHTH